MSDVRPDQVCRAAAPRQRSRAPRLVRPRGRQAAWSPSGQPLVHCGARAACVRTCPPPSAPAAVPGRAPLVPLSLPRHAPLPLPAPAGPLCLLPSHAFLPLSCLPGPCCPLSAPSAPPCSPPPFQPPLAPCSGPVAPLLCVPPSALLCPFTPSLVAPSAALPSVPLIPPAHSGVPRRRLPLCCCLAGLTLLLCLRPLCRGRDS